MPRLKLHRILAAIVAIAFCIPALAQGGPVSAAGPMQTVGAVNVSPLPPTVTGVLVARAMLGQAPSGRVVCRDQDQTAAVRALAVNRGLVLCTEEGRLVLLQLSASTGYYNRLKQRVGVDYLLVGDRINAWGILRNSGTLLSPTLAVQDITRPRPGPGIQSVTGILVAKPITGETASIPVACRTSAPSAQAAIVNRGIVLCTDSGRLILVQISASTRLLSEDRASASIRTFTIGDHLTAYGTLRGTVMDPTNRIFDTDLVRRNTASQDFIAAAGNTLNLYVLASEAGGPVEGQVQAIPGDRLHVTLCNRRAGSWGDLRQGLTIDIAASLFDRRIMTYVDTEGVRVVNCG